MNAREAILLYFFAFLACVFLCPVARAEEKAEPNLVLPNAVQIIGESAFENTAIRTVYLSDSVEHIGSRAFAETPSLRIVFIPDSTKFIADDAFDGHSDLLLAGNYGSYAHRWALEHGFAFIVTGVALLPENLLDALRRLSHLALLPEKPTQDNQICRAPASCAKILTFSDPKEKPEMYPVEYDFP